MNRLAQAGIIIIVLGGVTLVIGLFPSAVGLRTAQGIGFAQIIAILSAMFLLVAGGYLSVFAVLHRGNSVTVTHAIGIRLGLTGLVFAAAATLADTLGFGSHSATGLVIGWLQGSGMLIGFIIAALGVLVYGISRP